MYAESVSFLLPAAMGSAATILAAGVCARIAKGGQADEPPVTEEKGRPLASREWRVERKTTNRL